ncbi:MAG: hypothetical protein ACOCU4_07555, partial [Alkalispirochaeta sp.]
MKDTGLRVVTAVLAVGVFGLLVVTAIDGSVRTILNPRILPRTLIGAGVFALAAVIWVIDGLRRPHSGRGLSLAAAWPLLVPFILLPAAAKSSSSDYSQIRLFTAGGSGDTSAEAAYLTTGRSAPVSSGSGTLGGIDPSTSGSVHAPRDDDGEELEAGWVDAPNPALLEAVAAAEQA